MSAIAQLRPNSPGSPNPAILLAAVKAFPESLAIVASGLVVYANPAWCEMFEYLDRSQLQCRELEDLFPATAFSVETGAAPSNEREKSSEARFTHTRRDGTHLHLEVTRTGFQLRGREFQVIHTHDVSRQTQAERPLRESQGMEAIGRLVGGVAHDFNNLLTGIMLYCDLLLGELEEDSPPRRHVQEMRMAGEHGAALVHQLLAVARPAVDESQVFVLNDVVTGIEDLLVRLIGENIVLGTALAADLGQVKMDPAQVQQILLNLVLNARDAMPDGGRITVSTRNRTDPVPHRSRLNRKSCTGLNSPWLTPVTAWMPKPWTAPLSPSSPPRIPAAATAWAWLPLAGWSGKRAEPSRRKASREKARAFPCACREYNPIKIRKLKR